jgi:predicted anti-sigma-YlaC factor YlaD
MTCREMIEFLSDYLDGTLPQPAQTVFDRHVHHCSDCMDFLVSYKRSIKMARDSLTVEPCRLPEAIPDDLCAAIMKSWESTAEASRTSGDRHVPPVE